MSFESIQDFFTRIAAEHGDDVAVERDGDERTYEELDQRSNNVAGHLLALGAEPGDRVLLLLDDRFAVIEGILGALKARCAFVPVDPSFPQERCRVLAREVAARWVLTEAAFLDRVPELLGESSRVLCLDSADAADLAFELEGFEAGAHDEHPGLVPEPDDLAYVYFTSGTTGRPKGIAGRLKGIDHFVRWEIETFGLEAGTRVSQLTTPSFDAFLRDIFVPLCCGGTVCIPPNRETVLSPEKLVDWLDLEEIHLVHTVPSLFRSLFRADLGEDYFDEMRWVLLAGEPLLPADVGKWWGLFGDRIGLVNLYGASETTMVKLFHRVEEADATRPSVPVGRPMKSARAVVLTPSMEICPPGTVGEIYIRTPYRSLGYYGQPELTERVFVPNPFSDNAADVIYRSGDLGRLLESGDIELLGRKDGMVKIHGVRIELGEIESYLLEHDAVGEAVVVPHANDEGDTSLCAYVVLDSEVESGALRSFLEARLPATMLPAYFIALDEVPRTLTGKIDRKALPSPEDYARDLGADIEAPRSLTEEILSGIWCELLGVERVGIHQNFFEVGGHSLLATQLLARIRTTFEVEMPLNRLFESPTIAGLASEVEAVRRGDGVPLAPPVVVVERGQYPPLSFAQRRLWFLDRLDRGNVAYNIPHALDLVGPFDASLAAEALKAVMERHESLRTSFPEADGEPYQKVHPPGSDDLAVVDLTDRPEAERLEAAEEIYRALIAAPFDLAAGPLLRVELVRLAPSHHRLLMVMHHIVADAWSAALMLQDWLAFYDALERGEAPALPVLPVQHVDYAYWERSWLEGENKRRLIDFWKGALEGAPPLLQLPTDRPRPAVQTYNGAAVFLHLPKALKEDLEAVSRSFNSTLFMTLIAAFQVLLMRWSGQSDVVVGTPTAGRSRSEIERLVGFYVNPLVIRSDLGGNPTFNGALQRTRRTILEALSHQDLPFEVLVEAVQPERDRSYPPVYQVAFGLQNVPRAKLVDSELQVQEAPHELDSAKLDLDLNVGDVADGGLGGSLEYNVDLFDRHTAERMVHHFQNLLEALVEAPEQHLWEVPILAAEERHQLLNEWARGEAVECEDTVVRAIERRVDEDPAAVALVSGDETWSFGDLEREANQLAQHLLTFGAGPGVVVGLAMERSPRLVVAMLATLKAGAAFLPLDPSYPSDRLATMMEAAGLAILLTEEDVADHLPAHWGFTVMVDAEAEMIAAAGDARPTTTLFAEQAAYMIFTSGSTGQPKGVVLTHGGLANLVVGKVQALGLAPGLRRLQFASPSFDAAIFEIFATLASGGELHLAPASDLVPGPGLLQLLRDRRIQALNVPPSVLEALESADLPELELLSVAGEACPATVVRSWASGRSLFNFYGPTENTVWASYGRLDADDDPPTIGGPAPNQRLYVLDPSLRPAPEGVWGQLFLAGDSLSRGYLSNPRDTALAFHPDPFGGEAGERMYASGDVVRWKGAQLYFSGRRDGQVKVRGYRVEIGEVEAALLAHPSLQEAKVLLHGDTASQRRLAAWYLPEEGAEVSRDEIAEHLSQRLPAFMVPSEFTSLPTMPRTPAGKVDSAVLLSMGRAEQRKSAYEAPRNLVEELLCEVWGEILGLSRVGVRSSFFELGGYSLAATQVAVRVRELFGLELDLNRFFEDPTVEGLAREVVAGVTLEGGDGPGPRSSGERDAPLSLAQEVMWQRWRQDGNEANHHDNVSSALRLVGDLDVEIMSEALRTVCQRHEILRTVYRETEAGLRQTVLDEVPEVMQVDLRDDADPAAVALERARRLAREPFDLVSGPVVRCALLREAEQTWTFVLICHHITTDQWSSGRFIEEMLEVYRATSNGRAPELPTLQIQYADFAAWQRRRCDDGRRQRHLDFWAQTLGGAKPLRLPTDHARSAAPLVVAGREVLTLPAEVTTALHELAREGRATLFMTVIAAYQVLLSELTGSDDVMVDLPVANRRLREVEPLIGFFPGRLVLRSELADDLPFKDLVSQVRQRFLKAYDHMEVPLEICLDALRETLGFGDDDLRVSCNFYNAPEGEVKIPGVTAEALDLNTKTASSDLLLLLGESADGALTCNFTYRAELFEEKTVQAIVRRFDLLLRRVAKAPDTSVKELLATLADAEADLATV